MEDGQTTDGNGHGTHVAGTVGGRQFGVAKKVKLIAVRVLGNSGGGTLSGVVGGLDWIIRNRAGKTNAYVIKYALYIILD